MPLDEFCRALVKRVEGIERVVHASAQATGIHVVLTWRLCNDEHTYCVKGDVTVPVKFYEQVIDEWAATVERSARPACSCVFG